MDRPECPPVNAGAGVRCDEGGRWLGIVRQLKCGFLGLQIGD
jgi:hypothetical protein